MRLFDVLFPSRAKPTPALQAKERLQIVMAHQRMGRGGPDFLPVLQQELLAVIGKYVDLDANRVEVKLDRGAEVSTLEVNVEMPSQVSEVPARPAQMALQG